MIRFLRRIMGLEVPSPEEKLLGDLTVAALCEAFLASRVQRKLRPMTMTNYQAFLRWMTAQYGELPASCLTPDEIEMLSKLKSRDFACICQAMLRWGKQAKLLPKTHEIETLPTQPVSEDRIITRLSPADAHKLLAAVRHLDPEMAAAFVLGLFAGLRPMEICRITWAGIIREERRIRVEARESKVKKARNLEGLPDIIWQELPESGTGRVIPEDTTEHAMFRWIRTRRAAGLHAGIELYHDFIRHSFATYHVALSGNPAITAKLLGHHDLRMLAQHYDGVATKREARDYFRIPHPEGDSK